MSDEIDDLLTGLPPEHRERLRSAVCRIRDVVVAADGTLEATWLEEDCPEVRFTLPDMSRYHEVRRAIAQIHDEIPA
jgi:hypothetical protein